MDTETVYSVAILSVGLLVVCLVLFWGVAEFWSKKNSRQTTWVYCPGCKVELVSCTNRIVSDTDLVRYYCGECYTVSVWNFDFPVPVLQDSYYRDPNDWKKP